MTNRERDKQYQFVKLCISLTKQGLQFHRQKGVSYALTFDKMSEKMLHSVWTKMPFTNSIIRISGDNKKGCYLFEQWAGRN